jgi:hypothetical protein
MSDMNDDHAARAAAEPKSGRTPEEWARMVNDLFDRAKAKLDKEPHVDLAVIDKRFDDLLAEGWALNRKESEAKAGVGTFGFVIVKDGQKQRCVVEEILYNGRLLVRHFGFHAECSIEDFEPSRDAFFCGVSGIEPEWAGDSARCLNWEELGI